jgi:hypothetical protein
MWTRIVRKEEFIERAKVEIIRNTGEEYISTQIALTGQMSW